MVTTAKALAANFRSAANALQTDRDATVARTAAAVKKTMIAERNKAVGADGVMSGAGKLGVRYTDVRNGSVKVSATGPWQLIENDTKSAGVIVGRSAKTGRRVHSRGTSSRTAAKRLSRTLGFLTGQKGAFAGLRPLSVGGYGVFAKVRDKGTKGKKPWAKGVTKARPVAEREMRAKARDAVLRQF